VRQTELFASELPEGFAYQEDFVSAKAESQLLTAIDRLPFEEIRMHGVVAKRRAAHFGVSYEYGTGRVAEGTALPEFLEPLRQRVAAFAGTTTEDFAEALVTDYPPAAGIGWHRDAPAFDIIVGISLLTACTMRFRRWPPEKGAPESSKPLAQVLERRSAYILRGASRTMWQHHIPPMKTRRVSITFRTLRRAAATTS
jgi:alkylated DNA repair dioxygenase AlkB